MPLAGVGGKGARPRLASWPCATWRHLRESKAFIGPPEAMEHAPAERLDAHLTQSGVRRLNYPSGAP